ncbi:uncharacterized protein LOC117097867 isoform X1 [Trachypithecus francoisi]|uniref:uncharacterized protein LOC117097867 isoform X1 n=1 Tax=Trachypithecus francoisi TaxID=54180 RepID=UPI00141B03BB|nr:uncharacterized protein LOC117097867 isoform X1 [Trachypithecus francoisi]
MLTTWAESLPRGCTVGSLLPEPLPTGRSVHRDRKQWDFTKACAHNLRPNHHCTGGNGAQGSRVLAMEPTTRGPMANPRLCHPRSTQEPNPGPRSPPLVAGADGSLPHRDTCAPGPLGQPGRCGVDITAGDWRGPSPDSTQGTIMEFAPTLGLGRARRHLEKQPARDLEGEQDVPASSARVSGQRPSSEKENGDGKAARPHAPTSAWGSLLLVTHYDLSTYFTIYSNYLDETGHPSPSQSCFSWGASGFSDWHHPLSSLQAYPCNQATPDASGDHSGFPSGLNLTPMEATSCSSVDSSVYDMTSCCIFKSPSHTHHLQVLRSG